MRSATKRGSGRITLCRGLPDMLTNVVATWHSNFRIPAKSSPSVQSVALHRSQWAAASKTWTSASVRNAAPAWASRTKRGAFVRHASLKRAFRFPARSSQPFVFSLASSAPRSRRWSWRLNQVSRTRWLAASTRTVALVTLAALRSRVSDRPTSSDSLNWPLSPRRTKRLSEPVSINSRFNAGFRVVVLDALFVFAMWPRSISCNSGAHHIAVEAGFFSERSV